MLREETSRKRIYIWNAAGSAVYAASSFVMLLIVVRCCGDVEAGVFSIGFAIAQLMATIGIFEMTVYFATDAGNRFTYEQYLANKIITCILMVVVSFFYVLSFGFDLHKAAVAYALCAFRLVEAFSQFWFGAFQKQERLDIGGFSSVWRMVLAMLSFAIAVIATKDIVLASIVATISELVWLLAYDIPRLQKLVTIGRPDFSLKQQGSLLWAGLPLFLASFLIAYLNNVPKYAINDVGSDSMQAVFNVLFMLAFVINLFLIFFMRPSLTTLANHWQRNERSQIIGILLRLLLITVVLTIGALLICALIGIPVLELLYGIGLEGMLPALLVVMLGGGFMSAANIFYNALIVIRFQHTVIIGYLVAIVVASAVAQPLVLSQGIMGASLTYLIASIALLLALALLFLVCFFGISKRSVAKD